MVSQQRGPPTEGPLYNRIFVRVVFPTSWVEFTFNGCVCFAVCFFFVTSVLGIRFRFRTFAGLFDLIASDQLQFSKLTQNTRTK